MIVRKLNFFSPEEGYKKIEINIHEDKSLCAVYLKNKGYSIFIKDNDADMFLINTELAPDDFKLDENKTEKEECIQIVKILLDEIYANFDIPEYEKEHHEFAFLKIMDLFNTEAVEFLDEDSKLYKLIELGFMKLDVEILKITVNNELLSNSNEDEKPSVFKNLSSSFDSPLKRFKENKEE